MGISCPSVCSQDIGLAANKWSFCGMRDVMEDEDDEYMAR